LNAPKKPGTDLSALKARLAKKTEAAAPPPAEPAAPAAAPAAKAAPPARPPVKKPPAADLPPPGETAPIDIPPPGEVAAPIDIPAPGEVAIPAPGEVAPPPQPAPVAAEPAPVPPPRKTLEDGTPFGSTAGTFDPNAGLIADVGDVAPRGNKGLVAVAAAGALAFGVLLGWIGHSITSKGEIKAAAMKKGGEMLNEATKVADMRKGISLKLDELQKLVSTDPAKGAEELANLLKTNFEKSPKVDDLFGWQLAGIGPEGIRRTFDLYEEANGLRLDLGYLANFVASNAKALTESGGPRLLAIKFKKDGSVVLVERGDAICGNDPCPEGKEGDATGYQIREAVNQEFTVAARGTDDNQVLPLSADSQIYGYIVGLNPENNAKLVAASLFAKVKSRLEEMNKAEGRALKALKSYSENPNIDGSGPSDPGAD
jgi:hypothetical protein